MISRREKLQLFNKLRGENHAMADISLLDDVQPNHPKLARFSRDPKRYADEILYALLDFCDEKEIIGNREYYEGANDSSSNTSTEGEQGLVDGSSNTSTEGEQGLVDGSSNTSTEGEQGLVDGSSNTSTEGEQELVDDSSNTSTEKEGKGPSTDSPKETSDTSLDSPSDTPEGDSPSEPDTHDAAVLAEDSKKK